MDLSGLVSKLHPLERKVLPILIKHAELSEITKAAGLQEIEVMRALQWLENKQAVILESITSKQITLGKNGQKYLTEGIPERKLLKYLTEQFQSLSILTKKTNLSLDEISASIGLLKRENAIDIKKEQELQIKITPLGQTLLQQKSPLETFLQKKFPLPLEKLSTSDALVLEELKKRKEFILLEEKKQVTVSLTPLGQKLSTQDLQKEVINRLTPAMLKDSSWKNKELRSYDVEINVPKISGGRKHFDNEALSYIKRIWLDMGFVEMTGNFVQSAFWDLDALFVPQDHPAREMQDTFYLPGKAKLPAPVYDKVKAAHENGSDTKSTGWGYEFSKDEAQKILLRTHTTVLSAQTLSKLKKEDLPAKFFAVGRVFRNEALDWKHLFEFYQVDGIVIDPNANLKHLKGYLTLFYKKMGYSKVRMRPAHFPYTEPSLEVDVYHPLRKQWVELGGAGIFRPEVVKPLLGFDCPVLAWGQGMGRIISSYWQLNDIRDLYRNDLKQLREAKRWMKKEHGNQTTRN